MKTLTAMLALCWTVLFTGCALTPKPDPVKYSQELMATLSGTGQYVDMMNEAMNKRDYDKAESIIQSWTEALDKSIGEVEKVKPVKNDTGFREAVKKALLEYKRVANSDYKRLIDLRRKQVPGDDTLEPQIQSMVNRINTSTESITENLAVAANTFETKLIRK